MTAKQSVEQLRQKYLWSRENLPSFDFPHFLFQDFFPIIFEKTDFTDYIHPIIYWDKEKFETETFVDLFDQFFRDASLVARQLKKTIHTDETELKSYFKAYEQKYPRITLLHPFASSINVLNANFHLKHKYSKAWVEEIIKFIQKQEYYILNRFKSYDSIDERREWPRSCLLNPSSTPKT